MGIICNNPCRHVNSSRIASVSASGQRNIFAEIALDVEICFKSSTTILCDRLTTAAYRASIASSRLGSFIRSPSAACMSYASVTFLFVVANPSLYSISSTSSVVRPSSCVRWVGTSFSAARVYAIWCVVVHWSSQKSVADALMPIIIIGRSLHSHLKPDRKL